MRRVRHSPVTNLTIAPALVLGWGFLLVGLCATPTAVAQDQGETVKVRVQGFGEGTGRAARAAALTHAEEEAVSLIIAEMLPDEWWRTLDPIRNQLHAYVRTSRPVTSEQFADGVEVEAEVYVYEDQLRRDIAAVVFRNLSRAPRVALLVAEEVAGVQDWAVGKNGFAESRLRSRLLDAGFEVLPTDTLTVRYPDSELMEAQSAASSGLSLFGRDVGVDLVVRADAIVRSLAGDSPAIARYIAELELDVVRPTDALNIYQVESKAIVDSPDPFMGGRQAAEDSVDRVVRELLVECVLAHVAAPAVAHYTLSVALPGDGPWLSRLRRGIRDRIPAATFRDMRHTPTRARFSIEYDGKLGELVHALVDTPFERFSLETDQAAGFELDLLLHPTQ